jgi:FimV-like protein
LRGAMLLVAVASFLSAPWSHAQVDGKKVSSDPSWTENDGCPKCRMESDGCPACQRDGSEVAQLLQKADVLYAGFKTAEALKDLLKILQINPQHHEALCKTARAYIDLGDLISEFTPGWQEKRLKQYSVAEEYGRRAVKSDPNSTWGHFYVAAALGKIAMLSPIPKQIDLSNEIKDQVEKALTLDPGNGFAYHVYGVWQRRVAEIGQMSRMVASVLLWRTVPKGSFEKSEEYFNKAIALNPKVIVHRLELAKTYIAWGKWQQARAPLKSLLELPVQVSDDPLHKKEAQQLLQEINSH